jgi:hypothetical protein
MDTTARFTHHRPTSRRSRLRRWAMRLFALMALGAAIGSTYLVAAEAAGEDPPRPLPADLTR